MRINIHHPGNIINKNLRIRLISVQNIKFRIRQFLKMSFLIFHNSNISINFNLSTPDFKFFFRAEEKLIRFCIMAVCFCWCLNFFQECFNSINIAKVVVLCVCFALLLLSYVVIIIVLLLYYGTIKMWYYYLYYYYRYVVLLSWFMILLFYTITILLTIVVITKKPRQNIVIGYHIYDALVF